MSNLTAGLCRALLALALLLAGWAQAADAASAGDLPRLSPVSYGPVSVVPGPVKPNLLRPLQSAQARCPGGQLVFLSRACGCNGACCLCSRQTPYLNHCTCRCEAQPSPCAQGHSAGRP
jgi:hypothetical protein